VNAEGNESPRVSLRRNNLLVAALAGLLCLQVVGLGFAARAAAPASGTVRAPGDRVTWTGGPFDARANEGNTEVGTSDAPPQCPNDAKSDCDVFVLEVDPSSTMAVTVSVDALPTEDYDLYVFGPDGAEVGTSANPNGLTETVEIPAGSSGRFEVRVKPFTVTDGSTYDGAAVAESRTDPAPPPVPNDEIDAAPGGPFTKLVGFANKTGFRGVFTWQANAPVSGVVHLGTSPGALTVDVPAPGAPDTAQLAIAEGLTPGTKYYWQVEDLLSGETSGIGSFYAANAYTDWDGSTYTIDLLVQLDADSLPEDVEPDQSLRDIAKGVNVLAERVYDALDGMARIGDVIVTDTNLDYGANLPFGPQFAPVATGEITPCPPETNLGDVLVQSTVPFDSHTYGGFSINRPCTNFYVGREGQLVLPWANDLHFGYVSSHELMHYAFNAPDLYDPAGSTAPEVPACRNSTWDGSLMHNTGGWSGGRWHLTELDRNASLTPCDMGDPPEPFSWDALRERWVRVPANAAGPIDHVVDTLPRGNADGGALRIHILDRSPGSSTLSPYETVDVNPEPLAPVCAVGSPLAVDDTGDARPNNTGASEPTLDLTEVDASWAKETQALVVTTKLLDVRDPLAPPAAGSIGETIDTGFTLAGKTFYVRAEHGLGVPDAFALRSRAGGAAGSSDTTVESGLKGAFDAQRGEVRVEIPLSLLSRAAGVPAAGQVLADWDATAWRDEGAVLLRSDDVAGACPSRALSAAAGGLGAVGAAGPGYALLGEDGGIFTFGAAGFFGSTGGLRLNQPVVGMAWTPTGKGYWIVARDGGIFTFGDAQFFGSTGSMHLNAPILGMESSPSGKGYWLVASDGGIFTFGDARFHGSTGDKKLNAPVVGLGTSSTGDGYWLVARDGGIFTFGDARFHGSTGDRKLNEPVFDLASTATDGGYWLVARDGGIFTFGDAVFHGSAAGTIPSPVIGLASMPSDGGYWIANRAGAVANFGDAPNLGGMAGTRLNAPIVGFASTP
jgi:hypothetical protein